MPRCVISAITDGATVCQHVVGVDQRVAVGRSSSADLALASDPGLSRLHFEVLGTPAGFVARDLGSSNGLVTRGRRVLEVLLQDGQVLRAGTTDFHVRLLEDDEEEPTPPPTKDELADGSDSQALTT